MTGVDDAGRIELGVDKLLSTRGANFGISGPSASISQIIDGIKFYVSATLSNNHLKIKWQTHMVMHLVVVAVFKRLKIWKSILLLPKILIVFEKKRYEIDKRIIEVQTNISLNDDYSVIL